MKNKEATKKQNQSLFIGTS